jgi:hypothetical protein
MEPGAKRKASGLLGFLLAPLRARSHITEKLGPGWAIAADTLVVGGALGLVTALMSDVSGEARLGIFAGVIALAVLAGIVIGIRRKRAPKPRPDAQP